MDTQAERLAIVQAESERLQQYLADLPEDAWATPSACPLWAIRDVVAHLTTVMHNYRNNISRGQQGDIAPPEGRSEPPAYETVTHEERQQMATTKAQQSIALSARLGSDLLAEFTHACDQFNHLVASLTPHEWNLPCYHRYGHLPIRVLVNAAVFELAMHGWDIRSVLDPSTHLAPEAVTVMLDHFTDCMHWCFLPDAMLPTPIRYRFVLTGQRTSTWDIVVEGNTAHMAPSAETSPADATFRCDGEVFALLMCGKIRLEAAIADRRLVLAGDEALGRLFTKWFQGVE